jgi:hypothetical protein
MPDKDNQFWSQFLPEIKKTIDGALGALAKHENALASLSETQVGTYQARLDELRSRVEGCARQPEETMSAADALLQEVEAAYRNKLAGIETLRKQLADWLERKG